MKGYSVRLSTASIFFLISTAAFAGRVENLFDNLEGVVGNYKQSTVLLQDSPTGEPTDMQMVDPNTTVSVQKLSNDKYLLNSFEKGKTENAAGVTIIQRSGQALTITSHDFANPANSYSTQKATVADSAGRELTFYQSDVTYLDMSAAGIAARAVEQAKRQTAFETLIDAVALVGIRVPKEIAAAEDRLNLIFLAKGAANPVVISEIMLDPLGKSVRNPKGALSLTILRVFAK